MAGSDRVPAGGNAFSEKKLHPACDAFAFYPAAHEGAFPKRAGHRLLERSGRDPRPELQRIVEGRVHYGPSAKHGWQDSFHKIHRDCHVVGPAAESFFPRYFWPLRDAICPGGQGRVGPELESDGPVWSSSTRLRINDAPGVRSLFTSPIRGRSRMLTPRMGFGQPGRWISCAIPVDRPARPKSALEGPCAGPMRSVPRTIRSSGGS